MSFISKLLQIVQIVNDSPTFYTMSDLLSVYENGQLQGFGQCLALEDGEPFPATSDQYESYYTKKFSYEWGSSTKNRTFTCDVLTTYPLKILLNTVNRCASQLPSSISVDGTTMTKEDFISEYGNKLMFDLKNFSGQLSDQTMGIVGLEYDNQIGYPNLPLELKFTLGNDEAYAPITWGIRPGSYYKNDRAKFGGIVQLKSFGSTPALDLYMGYLNLSLGRTTWNNSIGYGDSDYCPQILINNGTFVSYLYDKEILDELIQDLNDVNIDINYYEEGISPLITPAIVLVHCPDGIISPNFDSDVYSYTLNSTRQQLYMQWKGSPETNQLGYSLDDSEITWGAASHLPSPTMAHTFNLTVGNHTIKLYAKLSNSLAYTYTFNASITNPESSGDGTGGTGNNNSDQIETQTTNTAGTLFNTSYLMNIDAVSHVAVELWNPNYLEMIRSLTTNAQAAIINLFLFPFDVGDELSGSSSVASDVYLGSYKITMNNDEHARRVFHGAVLPEFHFTSSQKIPSFFGSFLDENPYTTCMIYLPFLGYQEINPDFIYNRIIDIIYFVDISTGTAKIQLWSKEELGTNFLLNEWTCKIGVEIPLNASNFGQMKMRAALGGIELAKSTLAGGNFFTEGLEKTTSMVGELNVSSKPAQDSCDRTSPLDCFVLFIRNQPAVPENYDSRFGRPSMKKAKISDCSGYTTIINPQFETRATDTEKQELISLLENGIIIK